MLRLFMRVGNRFLAQNAAQGVLNQLYAATAVGLSRGKFIGPDGFREMRGAPTLVHPLPAATDPELAARLWRPSEDLTHLTFPSTPEHLQ